MHGHGQAGILSQGLLLISCYLYSRHADPITLISQSPPTHNDNPGDPNFMQNLSFSQSFQQYEVMGSELRSSRSSLLAAVIEKPEIEEKKTEKGQECREASVENGAEEQKTEKKKGTGSHGDQDRYVRDVLQLKQQLQLVSGREVPPPPPSYSD